MKICNMDSECILELETHTITEQTLNKIRSVLNKTTQDVIIDLCGVEDCVNSFYRMFENFSNITLVNIESSVLTTLYMTGFDKYVKIYGDMVSFEDKRHELINRRLKLV